MVGLVLGLEVGLLVGNAVGIDVVGGDVGLLVGAEVGAAIRNTLNDSAMAAKLLVQRVELDDGNSVQHANCSNAHPE